MSAPAPKLPHPSHPDAPKYWMDETGGALALAVVRFVQDPASMNALDIALVRAYLAQWVNSPVWDMNPHQGAHGRRELADLRLDVEMLATVDALRAWLRRAFLAGIDPL